MLEYPEPFPLKRKVEKRLVSNTQFEAILRAKNLVRSDYHVGCLSAAIGPTLYSPRVSRHVIEIPKDYRCVLIFSDEGRDLTEFWEQVDRIEQRLLKGN